MEQNLKNYKKKITLITSIIFVIVTALNLSACKQLSYYEELQSMPTLDSFNKDFTLADTKTDDETGRITYSYTFTKEDDKDSCYMDYCEQLTELGFNLYDAVNQKPFNKETFSVGYIVCYDSKWVGTVWCFWQSNEVEIGINTNPDSLVSETTLLEDFKNTREYSNDKSYDSAYGYFPLWDGLPSPISVESNIYFVRNYINQEYIDTGYYALNDSPHEYEYVFYSMDTFENYIDLLSKLGYQLEKDYDMSIEGFTVYTFETEQKGRMLNIYVQDKSFFDRRNEHNYNYNYKMSVNIW